MKAYPVDLIIFDLDGTLVNTLEDLTAAVNHALLQFGGERLSVDTVREYVGDGARKLLMRALKTEDAAVVEEGLALFGAYYLENVCVYSFLYPGVEKTLLALRHKKLALFTNKPANYTDPLLQSLGIGGFFAEMLGGGMGIHLKPAPDGIAHICRKLQVPPEKTLMVGDSATDIQAAKAAGALSAAVTYGFRSKAHLEEAQPDILIDEISKLLAYIR